MANVREYIASEVIYKEDVDKLIEVHENLRDYVNGFPDYENLNRLLGTMSNLALTLLTTGNFAASMIASGLSNWISLSVPSEKAAMRTILVSGINALNNMNTYFEDHPSFEAVRANVAFWEETDENVRIITDIGDITSILVGGIWQNP